MEILITSDIHSNTKNLDKLKQIYPNIKTHLNAGDSELSLNYLKERDIISVLGNTDYDNNLEKYKILFINNKKILLIHGHEFNVKQSLINLSYFAKSLEVDIVIFGHTHIPFNKIINNILYINPGSLGFDNTYVILKENKVRFYSLWMKK